MSDVHIQNVKLNQAIACKCGHQIKRGDVRGVGDRVEIVCSACHASVVEIECLVPEGIEQWD